MDFIVYFLALLGGLLIIGTICAIAENHKDDAEDDREDPPRVVISQQVPSVFDTFKKKE